MMAQSSAQIKFILAFRKIAPFGMVAIQSGLGWEKNAQNFAAFDAL